MGKRAIGAILFVISIVSVTTGAVFFQQVPSGMDGFWRLEEVASPSADSSGNGHTSNAWPAGVTAVTGAANLPSALGANSTACLAFNGSATAILEMPTAVNLSGDFTAALWVYKAVDAGDYVRIIGKGASGVRTFGLWEEPGAPGRVLFQQVNTGGAYFVNYWSSGSIPLTQWTHVACRISGNIASIFINGANSGNFTRSGVAATDAEPVTLGYGRIHDHWNGRLDDVRLYTRALSDADILELSQGKQGPPAPSLTVTYGATTADLSWTGSALGFNVKRSSTPGGPYTTIAPNVAGPTYTDTTGGAAYYYVVSGVTYGEGPNSNEGLVPVTALPNTGLFTSEPSTPTNFTIKFNSPAPAAGSVLTVVSNLTTEGVVSTAFDTVPPSRTAIANGFTLDIPAFTSPTFQVTVTGADDSVVDPAHAYTVTVTATNIPFPIPNVQLTNNDDETPGITFSKTAGLVTTEVGGPDSFTVSLSTQPFGPITMSLTSSNTAEATVSPSSITFTTGNWFTPQPVTVTGVDDLAIDFTQAYTIVSGNLNAPTPGDGVYNGMKPPDVSGVNLDNESIPPAHGAWGGCGLLGAEIGLPLLLLALWRRRRAT